MKADFLKSSLPLLLKDWAVFPVAPNRKVPLTKRGHKDASKEMAQIKEWSQQFPNANIGIATGQISHLAVVDIDVKNNKSGMESIAVIPALIPKDTYTVRTPSGGIHYYYSISVPLRSRINFMDGVDIKADGGYVVGTGSTINEQLYSCISDVPARSIHEFLLLSIQHPPPRSTDNNIPYRQTKCIDKISVGVGNWNDPILRATASMVSRGFSDENILKHMGQYTLSGWTIEQTHREVMKMITSARRKGFDRHK